MSTPWGSFPKDVVPSARLAALTGAGNQVGAHIAAHKVYFALALEVNFVTREVEMGMSFLQDRTKLSRPMLGRATSALEAAGVLKVDRDGYRNRYTQLMNAPNSFRQVPRFATRQALQLKFSRGISVLAAWKLYPVLLYLRNGQTGDALATHETLQRYSTAVGLPRLPEAARAQPVEALGEGNMVHGAGENGACHLPC